MSCGLAQQPELTVPVIPLYTHRLRSQGGVINLHLHLASHSPGKSPTSLIYLGVLYANACQRSQNIV
jgi:hypothetical protein